MLTRQLRRLWNRDSRGAAAVLLAQVGGAGLSLLFSVLLARLIGAAEIGLYFIALTVIEIGATFARLGLDHAVLRFVSIAHSQDDRGSMAAIYRRSLGVAFGMAIAVALPVWLVFSNLALGGERAQDLQAVLPLLMIAIAPVAALALQAEFLKAIGAPGTSAVVQSTIPALGLLTGAAALWWLTTVTLQSVMLLYVVVLTCGALFAFSAIHRLLPGLWREKGRFDLASMVKTGLPLLVFASMNLVMNWTDILVLGTWSGPAEVGIYGVAMRIASLSVFILTAANSVVAPQFAALHARGEQVALDRLARRSGVWMLLAVSPGILLLLAFPEFVLQLFGSNFEQGAWPLRILILGQLVNVGTGSVGYLLIMTGNQTLLRNNTMVWAAINLAGNLLLVPSWGAVGAATSTAVCLASMNLVSWWIVRKKLKIDTLAYLYSWSSLKS